MENNNEHNIKKGHFDAFVHAVGSEIEQAQVRLITAANAQMLFHYWKMGNYILYQQSLYGWGGKIINKLAQAIRFNYPEKKGYSVRNLSYMCQFAKAYPLSVLKKLIETDTKSTVTSILRKSLMRKYNRQTIKKLQLCKNLLHKFRMLPEQYPSFAK